MRRIAKYSIQQGYNKRTVGQVNNLTLHIAKSELMHAAERFRKFKIFAQLRKTIRFLVFSCCRACINKFRTLMRNKTGIHTLGGATCA